MKYKVTILRDICIGAASCMAVAPKAFSLDKEGKVITLSTLDKTAQKTLVEAAMSCPVNAIIITNQKGLKVWPK